MIFMNCESLLILRGCLAFHYLSYLPHVYTSVTEFMSALFGVPFYPVANGNTFL
jgi:hypothetical protein